MCINKIELLPSPVAAAALLGCEKKSVFYTIYCVFRWSSTAVFIQDYVATTHVGLVDLGTLLHHL